ncbi:hypothetical protein BHE90_012082 [Fusarium euwallaceae]|uniref:Uncharacterized protein n=2 Tax=Fusarium solani species complex TaxID=232080 RepID=A0A430LCN3_9HYPO|nr:hypothetical protein CDV31_003654 [Fusarium ambrosium]RTE73496.1 hypothetical protein BHE90_012082 [Fusarium euwallaceae]
MPFGTGNRALPTQDDPLSLLVIPRSDSALEKRTPFGASVCCPRAGIGASQRSAAGTKVLRGSAPTRRDRPFPAQRLAPAIDLGGMA